MWKMEKMNQWLFFQNNIAHLHHSGNKSNTKVEHEIIPNDERVKSQFAQRKNIKTKNYKWLLSTFLIQNSFEKK